MKVKIAFELDLKDTHYNIKKIKLIPICLQNLGQWFYELHLHYLTKRIDDLYRVTKEDSIYDGEDRKAIMEDAEQNLKLSEQLFHNYKIEGITDDGHTFQFTHQGPVYKEETLVDGVKTYIEPYDGD